MLTALNRKLLRECWHHRGQMASIALVVACGIMTVVSMRGTYGSLADALERYYRDYYFADVFASLERAPAGVGERIAELPGVAVADTRIAITATLDVPGLAEPAIGRILSLPAQERSGLNRVHIVRGSAVNPARPDEILISESFADANRLELGAEIGAVIKGRSRKLEIVGVAISPDYIGEVAPGTAFPDDRRFAVIRMDAKAIAGLAGMEGAFNEVAVQLTRGASEPAVLQRIDRLLEPYGGQGAYGRDRQPSHQSIRTELEQNRITGTLIPVVFLGVAAFLLSVVLGRLISTQRNEIAVLKAFGYGNPAIALHYLKFALLPVVGGSALGVGLGIWFGRGLTGLYGDFFRFPRLEFHAGWALVIAAVVAGLVAAAAGALGAVARASHLQPAEAMRPELPPRFRPGPLERLGIGHRMSASARFVLRGLERRPLRSVISILGVALATSLVAGTMVVIDSTRFMVDHQFRRVQREDLAVTFASSRPSAIRLDLARIEGVSRVELTRAIPVRIRHLHRERTTALTGITADGALRRIVDRSGRVRSLPARGVVVSTSLADALDLRIGDVVTLEVLQGRRQELRAPVAGTVEELFGTSIYMDFVTLHTLLGESPTATGAYLRIDPTRQEEVSGHLKRLPSIAGAYSPAAMRNTFEEQLSENLLLSIGFLLGLACVLTVGVIYNGSRIALSERARELASLRVLGFNRREVSVLLLGEQAALTAVAIPFGWGLGIALMAYVLSQLESEQYRIPLVVTGKTFLLAAAVTAAAAVAASFAVRRRLDRLDLIEVLKTRE